MAVCNGITEGQKFGRLTVKQILPVEPGKVVPKLYCVCDCGEHTVKTRIHLLHDKIMSCGCLRRVSRPIHGHAKKSQRTRVYAIWKGMLSRCRDRGNSGYKHYGARGISVCERWLDFKSFLEDMGYPSDGLSIDRIDVNGNYEKNNCRWATRNQQARNTRNSVVVEYLGQRKSIHDWADVLGIKASTLKKRLSDGWSTEKALGTPVLSPKDISLLGISAMRAIRNQAKN